MQEIIDLKREMRTDIRDFRAGKYYLKTWK
jgi:hypothetical protein